MKVSDPWNIYGSRNGTRPWVLKDVADMPGFNLAAGAHGIHSVSEGRVSLRAQHKVSCWQHGAMNAVNPEGTIWRCLTCHEAGYVERAPK